MQERPGRTQALRVGPYREHPNEDLSLVGRQSKRAQHKYAEMASVSYLTRASGNTKPVRRVPMTTMSTRTWDEQTPGKAKPAVHRTHPDIPKNRFNPPHSAEMPTWGSLFFIYISIYSAFAASCFFSKAISCLSSTIFVSRCIMKRFSFSNSSVRSTSLP